MHARTLHTGLTLGFILLCCPLQGAAQEAPEPYPVTIGYFGPYGIQPGFTVGTAWHMDGPAPILRPRMGFFTWPRDHWSAVAGIEAAWRIGAIRSSVTAGIDYFFERRILDLAVDIGSGALSPNRETRHHLVPTVGYRVDWTARRPWFAQVSLGKRLSFDTDDAAIIVLSFGTTLLFDQE